MGASKKFKKILIDRGISMMDFAETIGSPRQTVYNLLCRDVFRYSTIERWLDAINCEIVFRDKETGKIYD